VITTRPREQVIAELDSLTKIVKATETRHGKSLEDIETQYHEASLNYSKADKQIKEQAKSLKVGYHFPLLLSSWFAHPKIQCFFFFFVHVPQVLKVALSLRKERWIQFRTHIAVRAKMKFVTHLSKRGYSGKLNFNHQTQRLDIQVCLAATNIQKKKKKLL
jgi:hypothetical protein